MIWNHQIKCQEALKIINSTNCPIKSKTRKENNATNEKW
jgi:hypothetical protein